MSQVDGRGFEYALEPARRRSQHRVDTAVSALGQQQRALDQALGEVARLRARCDDLARQSQPGPNAVIDPWRSMAAARAAQLWRGRLDEAQRAVAASRDRVAQARGVLEQARLEHEAFENHHADALQAHQQVLAQRQQNSVDQDWLARRHQATAAWHAHDERDAT